jgi:hypothetical protein
MRRFLVVANQTLGGDHLVAAVHERLARGPCSFYVVVPKTPPRGHALWVDEEAAALAEERLAQALARFRELGADVDGEVGDRNPIQAIGDAMRGRRGEHFDEIIVSTLPPGPSRWLRMDLPHRVEQMYRLPVTHVVGERAPARAS